MNFHEYMSWLNIWGLATCVHAIGRIEPSGHLTELAQVKFVRYENFFFEMLVLIV